MSDLLESLSSQPAHTLWLLSGLCFLGLEMLVGEPSIAALGLAAIITAVVALSVKTVSTQILIWGILAIALSVLFRGMMPNESKDLSHPTEALVAASIPPGGVGQVTYEGTIWMARCQISDVAIASGQTVHVVGRQANTLIVLPTVFPDSEFPDSE